MTDEMQTLPQEYEASSVEFNEVNGQGEVVIHIEASNDPIVIYTEYSDEICEGLIMNDGISFPSKE